jgi:hypothetical protein
VGADAAAVDKPFTCSVVEADGLLSPSVSVFHNRKYDSDFLTGTAQSEKVPDVAHTHTHTHTHTHAHTHTHTHIHTLVRIGFDDWRVFAQCVLAHQKYFACLPTVAKVLASGQLGRVVEFRSEWRRWYGHRVCGCVVVARCVLCRCAVFPRCLLCLYVAYSFRAVQA